MAANGFQRLMMSAAVVLAGAIAPAAADELTAVFADILADPTNTELNLQYALIAEGRGEYRKALGAYERILANDPGNASAKRGLQRVRRILQPPSTTWTFETGLGYESNPLHEHHVEGDGDGFAFVKARVRDERTFGTTRWRTTGNLFGEGHFEDDELNYAIASGTIGPILDIPGTMTALIPEIGGAVSSLDGRFYYAEVNASATLEGYLDGAYQWARVRAGWRDYDSYWTTDSGWYADVMGKWTRVDIFGEDDAFSIALWIRWSNFDGSIVDAVSGELQPGDYLWGGARFQYDRAMTDWLSVSLFFSVSDRLYGTDKAPNGDHREDLLLSPGVALLFDDVLGNQTDLRVEYKYEDNDSNDRRHDYQNHQVMVSVSKRM